MEKREDTKQKLLKAAEVEFSEKGFKNASLRNICKNAEVTTGAVYFFFKSKEGLFAAVLQPFYEQVMKLLSEHIKDEKNDLKNNREMNQDNDEATSRELARLYYTNKEVAKIFLEKSGGTIYEHFLDDIIVLLETEFYGYFNMMKKEVDTWIVHWYAHLMVDSHVQTLLHFETEQEALPRLRQEVKILQSVWYQLFVNNNKI